MTISHTSDVDINLVRQWALEAGEIALARFQHVEPWLKSGDEWVTVADGEIERLLVERIRAAYPAHRILGEEMGAQAGDADRLWAIDPIDGTRAFVHGLPVWGISIGLLAQRRPTQAVFYMPCLREMYHADATGPAHWNDRPLPPIEARAWTSNDLLCVPADAHRRYRIAFSGVTRAMGSTAANMIYVARGSAVGALIGRVHIWDIAAALVILERAGGALRYLSGQPVDMEALLDGRAAPEPMLAAHPDLLPALLEEIEVREAR